MKKILTTLLILTLTVSMNAFCSFAYADTGLQGEGTEENPYLLYTRADLFCVNNDVNASYKLMGDIDLEKQEFTPVGNAEAGAFAGTFDGNGYTISNLKVSSGKYAALFGCNEGIVKNIVLKNIDVSGTRYAAGVVAENAEAGIIADCKVLSGKVQGVDGLNPLNIGGICGLNGGKLKGVFENRASVKSEEISSIAGGIVGKSTADVELSDVKNYGDITGDCAGGIVGMGNNVSINCGRNSGDIANIEKADICDTYDYATFGYAAGITGNVKQIKISVCYNTGTIKASRRGAGLISQGDSITIRESYNTGLIDMLTYHTGGGGWVTKYREPQAGGLALGDDIDIQDSFNGGNISQVRQGEPDYCAPISNGGNFKNVLSFGTFIRSHMNYAYNGKGGEFYGIRDKHGRIPDSCAKTEIEMRSEDTFPTFDLENVWVINANENSGYPRLRSDLNPLQINYGNKIVCKGDSVQLTVFKNGLEIHDVSWKIVDGAVSVSSNGKVKAEDCGRATITAIDNEGNKANCNLYVLEKSDEFDLQESSWNLISRNETLHFDNLTNTDYIMKISSSNDEILKVSGATTVAFENAGTADLTVETASGVVKTFPVSITNHAVGLKLSKTSSNIGIGHQLKLEATIEPNPTSSTLTWNSSNPEVATVDQEGNVTGKSAGEVTITAQTDNGLQASCEVTVFKPIERIEFETKEVTVYKGDTVKIKYSVYPEDATESVRFGFEYPTYTSTTCPDITLSDSKGTIKITGKNRSTWTIKASASYISDTFSIKVIDYPTIVTGVTLDQTKYDMKTGEVFKLNATVVPSNATDKSITWASTDSSVASVSEAGTVSAIGAGKAVITATSGNGVIAACEVTVTGVASTNLSRIYIPEIFDAKSEIINVPVMIEYNPGISFINFSVSYDKEKMEPLEINNGALFESVMGSIDAENGKIKLIFSSDTDITKSGVLAKIKFKRKNMEEDITDLSVSYYPDGVMNKKQKRIALKMSDGRLNAYRSTICGDVDENRKVDFADALYFKRYLANWSKYQDVSLKTANLDSDNEITPADLIILERHIAGWTGYQNIPQNQN